MAIYTELQDCPRPVSSNCTHHHNLNLLYTYLLLFSFFSVLTRHECKAHNIQFYPRWKLEERGQVDERSKPRVTRGNSNAVKTKFQDIFKGEIWHYINPVQESSEYEDMEVCVPTCNIPTSVSIRKLRRSKQQANTEEDVAMKNNLVTCETGEDSDEDDTYSDEESD